MKSIKPTLYTLPIASRYLGVPYKQLLSACKYGEIPYYQLGTSLRMVKPDEVLEYIRQVNKGGYHG